MLRLGRHGVPAGAMKKVRTGSELFLLALVGLDLYSHCMARWMSKGAGNVSGYPGPAGIRRGALQPAYAATCAIFATQHVAAHSQNTKTRLMSRPEVAFLTQVPIYSGTKNKVTERSQGSGPRSARFRAPNYEVNLWVKLARRESYEREGTVACRASRA